jgi:alkylresorcinol/alkylpyrone synthase
LPHRYRACLLSIATAAPEIILPQAEAKAVARKLFGMRARHFDKLAPVFDNAGIDERHIVRPVSWYETDLGWKERNQVYLEASELLYIEVAGKALDKAGVNAADVDVLVTVSTTGIATPSLEARVAGQMGFRDDAQRIPIFGLGCAGGVSGLATAARLAGEDKIVLFVTIELCSTSIRLDKLSKANIVATALFGDGAAACLLRGGERFKDEGIATIGEGAEILWPDTLGIMGWDVEDPGLGVIFDRSIPPFVEANMAEGVRRILEKTGDQAVDRYVCHPGGAKVILALEQSLELPPGTLDHERAVLRDYGNMSAPTVLFVLERAIEAGLPDQVLLLALGPGFTASGLRLSRS